jgi:hypothetical protein
VTFEEAVEQALRSTDPFDHLRSLVQDRLSQGEDQASLLAQCDTIRQRLRDSNREADEDALMDVMDCLVGWCGSHMDLSGERGRPRSP